MALIERVVPWPQARPAALGDPVHPVHLVLPVVGPVALLQGDGAEHDGPAGVHRDAAEFLQEGALGGAAGDIGAELEDAGIQPAHDGRQMGQLAPVRHPARHRPAVRARVGDGARGGQPHRARAERLLDDPRHRLEVIVGRKLVQRARAHRIHAQRRMADIGAVIDRLGQRLHRRQIFREGLPGPVDAGHHGVLGDVLDSLQALGVPLALLGLAGRQRKAAIAHDDAGDAVPAGAASERVPGHLRVHVGVPVDEARRDDPPFGVDRPRRRCPYPPDLRNPAVPDAHIGPVARHAGAIDHRAARDNQIECHVPSPSGLGVRRCKNPGSRLSLPGRLQFCTRSCARKAAAGRAPKSLLAGKQDSLILLLSYFISAKEGPRCRLGKD